MTRHFPRLKVSHCFVAFFAAAFQAFGMYHVHALSGVTEGGILGLILLLDHWFSLSPAVSSFVLNSTCYLLGWKSLGRNFVAYSLVAALGYSAAYALCEHFPPIWPPIAEMPLAAALIGALFIGIGAGLCVRVGGATSGDDALAMSFHRLTHLPLACIYLMGDLPVLLLSLSYIPANRIVYSLLSVVLSSRIIDRIQKFPAKQT